jgi:hypothetical protein
VNRVQRTRILAVLPEMAAPSKFHVRIPGLIGVRPTQPVCERILLPRNCHEVDVIGHQTITPPAHPIALAIFPEQLQVNLSILVGIENGSPAIAPLCHMMRQTYRNHTRDSSHPYACELPPDCSQKLVK